MRNWGSVWLCNHCSACSCVTHLCQNTSCARGSWSVLQAELYRHIHQKHSCYSKTHHIILCEKSVLGYSPLTTIPKLKFDWEMNHWLPLDKFYSSRAQCCSSDPCIPFSDKKVPCRCQWGCSNYSLRTDVSAHRFSCLSNQVSVQSTKMPSIQLYLQTSWFQPCKVGADYFVWGSK